MLLSQLLCPVNCIPTCVGSSQYTLRTQAPKYSSSHAHPSPPPAHRLQVQIAALEILPCIPPHKLRSLMASDTSFPATLTRQMATSVKDVAAAAIAALGACLSDPLTSDQLATTKGIAATARAWAGLVAEALLDPSQLLAAAACSAARCSLVRPAQFAAPFLEGSQPLAACLQTQDGTDNSGWTAGRGSTWGDG